MSLVIRTDVTSVKFHKKFILVGIGGSINIFEKSSGKLLQRLLCLKGQKIYGIVPSRQSQKILVFGGKQFSEIDKSTEDPSIGKYSKSFEQACDDWLHSGVWIDEDVVALLTAHNVVQVWNTKTQILKFQHSSKDNSILYSGVLQTLDYDILVMAGTVYSEVIVHISGVEEALYTLEGHKGVIFSITCDLQRGIIVTTSDDRSVRIWGPNIIPEYPSNTTMYWICIDIVCKYELYGHTARVMRSCVNNDYIISVGEDAGICFWNYDGSLAKKVTSHQNGCIWSLDADEDVIVTGGGDCAVIVHPVTLVTDYCKNEVLNFVMDPPKKVAFTARKNIIILSENDDLIFYNVEDQSKTVHKLNHDSTYKLLSISTCKQMVAIADMNGKLDVYAETCKDSASLINIIDAKLSWGKILSMQWAGNRYLVLCVENGVIKVLASKESNSETYTEFLLPPCKERWLTSCAVDTSRNIFIFGDRCGNIHVYVKGQMNPIRTFNKVHGRYGPTSIICDNTDIITTGRDGTVKYFSINDDKVRLMCSRDLEFKWVEKFLDKDKNIICGFQERVFVAFNIKANSKLLEVPCGGGHRSWDAMRHFEKVNNDYEEFITLVYLKNSDVNIVKFQLNNIVSKSFVKGSHSKEINCMKIVQSNENSPMFFISGGEDTTLRISSIDSELEFEDHVIFKQLSSIRALKTCNLNDNTVLVIAAGGRAQICVKLITFIQINNNITVKSRELIDYMIKGTDKVRKGNQNWRNCAVDFDPETRIMDVDYINDEHGKFCVFAGCSDASLRIFQLEYNTEDATFQLINELKYHKTCILKTVRIEFKNNNILATCSTTGEVALWNVLDLNKHGTEPFIVIKTNKSGINSFAWQSLDNDRLLIATGGDDNAIHLLLLQVTNQKDVSSMRIIASHVLNKQHSSEITGLCLLDKFILSTSIDQRITLFEWREGYSGIICRFLSQTYSDVADIQGMEIIKFSMSSITVCVFGKGMEVIEVPIALK